MRTMIMITDITMITTMITIINPAIATILGI